MKYFTIEELCASDTAKQRGIDNTPDETAKEKLTSFINNLLDPIREKWGKPIIVNSGYRSPELNKAVGGVSTSQHQSAEAADITTGNIEDNKKLFELIRDNFVFDQLIDEKNYSWIHISYRNMRNRMLVLHLN